MASATSARPTVRLRAATDDVNDCVSSSKPRTTDPVGVWIVAGGGRSRGATRSEVERGDAHVERRLEPVGRVLRETRAQRA